MADVWFHIAFAPKDGRRVRVKSDEGSTHVAQFSHPMWWNCGTPGGPAILRLADDVLYDDATDLIRAVQFQELPNG